MIGNLFWRLRGRWFAYRDWWFPNFFICYFLGHSQETHYWNGEWCCRCGGPIEE